MGEAGQSDGDGKLDKLIGLVSKLDAKADAFVTHRYLNTAMLSFAAGIIILSWGGVLFIGNGIAERNYARIEARLDWIADQKVEEFQERLNEMIGERADQIDRRLHEIETRIGHLNPDVPGGNIHPTLLTGIDWRAGRAPVPPPEVEREGFALVDADLLPIERLLGAELRAAADDGRLGQIEKVVAGDEQYFVVDTGGLLGLAGTEFGVGFDEVTLLLSEDGDEVRAYVAATQDEVDLWVERHGLPEAIAPNE